MILIHVSASTSPICASVVSVGMAKVYNMYMFASKCACRVVVLHVYLPKIMPHPNKNEHVITRTREQLGMTRPDLAKKARLSTVYLQKLESGKRPMTEKVANQLSIETCVDPRELMKGAEGQPITSSGDLVTRDLVTNTDQFRESISAEDINMWRDRCFRVRIMLLLDAAAQAEPSRFWMAWYSLHSALTRVEKDLGLSKGVEAQEKLHWKTLKDNGRPPYALASRMPRVDDPANDPPSKKSLGDGKRVYPSVNAEDLALIDSARKTRYEARAAKATSKLRGNARGGSSKTLKPRLTSSRSDSARE